MSIGSCPAERWRDINSALMPILFLIVFIDLVGFGLVIPLLPFYAERFAATPLQMTTLFATFSLMAMVTAPLWGRLSDRVGRRPVLMVSMAAAVVAYGWLAFADRLWMVFAARAFAGACAGNIAAAQAYIADVTAPEDRARGMGMIGAAFGLGFIIGPVLGGVIAGDDLATADLQTPALIAAGLALIAISFAVGSYAIADGIRNRNRSDVIVVTGSAKKRIVSDYVIWSLSVSSRQKSTSEAVKELARWTDAIRSFLHREGVEPGELTVEPIATGTVTRSGRVVAYRLSRRFEVRSARAREITNVAGRSSELLAQGVPLAAQPPEYVYTRLPELRPQLLAAATKDAQNRGRVIAEATGAHLGRLRGVDVGVFQVTTPNSTEVEDYGVYDTGTLEKDVTAVVNVTFALE